MIGIVIVLVLSASMSTLSSLVLTSGSTVTLDFIVPMRKKQTSDRTKMILIRVFIVLFIVVSAWIAIAQYHNESILIAQMMGISWGALAGAFLAPFLYGLYWKGTTRAGVVSSFVFGVGLELVQLCVSLGWLNVSGSRVLSFVFNNSLYSGVFAMAGGHVLVPLVSVLSRRTCPKNTEHMFACYRRTVVSPVTETLGDE